MAKVQTLQVTVVMEDGKKLSLQEIADLVVKARNVDKASVNGITTIEAEGEVHFTNE